MTRPIGDAIEKTLAELDLLNQRHRERNAADFAKLQTIRDRLDEQWVDEDELVPDPFLAALGRRPTEPQAEGRGGDVPPLPEGRPGHPLGPAVRAKLIGDAVDRGGW